MARHNHVVQRLVHHLAEPEEGAGHRSGRSRRESQCRTYRNAVLADEHHVRLQLGREPIVLPEPLDTLVRGLVASRHGHATLGDQGTSRWLFPGGQPGQPISADRLGERLHQLGLRPGQARSTALFGLASELPAALLSRLLGININVAVTWQRAAAGDWTNYAADYSRRGNPKTVTKPAHDDHS